VREDISERTGLSCSTIYYWFANAEFRSKRKKYCGEYRVKHPEKYQKGHDKYEIKTESRKIKRADPKIKEHNRLQAQFRRKVYNHLEELLPELIPIRGSPVTIEEMANNLWDISGGMVVRPKTLQKSVESYLTCFPYLAIQDSSRNIRDLPPEKKNIVYIKEIKSGIYIRL